jgi:hypothetical protein
MLRSLFTLAVIAFWFLEHAVLQWAAPIYVDGAGPLASFYWGQALDPTLAEWHRSAELQEAFLLPYKIVATILTFIACVLIPFVSTRMWSRSNLFGRGVVLCCLAVLALCVANDVIARLEIVRWIPVILSPRSMCVLAAAVVPAVLMAGICSAMMTTPRISSDVKIA